MSSYPQNGVQAIRNVPDETRDWRRIAYLMHLSRALDSMEEERLVPEKKVLYQFSARGHDMAQVLLGTRLSDPHDAACGYYRSRPMLLSLGVDVEDALGSSMGRAGGYSDGRDIGVVFNYPNPRGASALPMCGGVGAQYTPTAGWAQAIEYHRTVLDNPAYLARLAIGGNGSGTHQAVPEGCRSPRPFFCASDVSANAARRPLAARLSFSEAGQLSPAEVRKAA